MTQRARALRRQCLPQFAVKASVHAVLLALAATAAAQTTTDETQQQQLQKVEITGSAIKRIDAETALPVQIINREAIDKAGVTTAAELMAKISASSNNLTDGVSIASGGYRDQMGFNSANLRGLGASSTLVLLNGRRMANFASPGDDSGVDLNNIPAAAIQRVEVLLEGESEESELLLKGRMGIQAPDIDGHVLINDVGSRTPATGKFYEVEITDSMEYDLIGRIV